MTLKRPQGIAGLVQYIFKEESRYVDDQGKELVYNYNLRKGRIADYVQQFKDNLTSLSHTTKRVQVYHFILSWVEQDREKVTAAIMRRFVRKFIGLHSQGRAAYIAVGHGKDTPHPHIHVLCPGLQVGQKKATYVTRQRFSEIQQDLQLFSKRFFPELAASRINYGQKEREEKNVEHTEFTIKRNKRTSKKQELEIRIKQIAVGCRSEKELLNVLAKENVTPYYRNNKLAGFKDPNSDRKYRIKTLNLEKTITALAAVHHKTKNPTIEKSPISYKTKKVSCKTNEVEKTEKQHPQYRDILEELAAIRAIAEEQDRDDFELEI